MTRVWVAAPSVVVSAGLESVVASSSTTEVVGASNLISVGSALEQHLPDVVLASVDGHQDDSPEELIALAARDGGPAVVIVSGDLQPASTADALRAGIRAVLPGDASPREILAALEAAAAGLVVLHAQDLPAILGERAVPLSPGQPLSRREIQVLSLLAEGSGNKAIAWKLGISEHTVKFHVALDYDQTEYGNTQGGGYPRHPHGADTNLRNMSSGYEALRAGAAWLDLSARGRIYATGEDRARLLHAMTTNDVKDLTPGTGCYAFFLNAQGQIQADVNLLCLEDRFLLDTEPETREFVFRHLDKYIIADDVTLEDVTATLTSIAVEGPNAGNVLAALGGPTPEREYGHESANDLRIERVSATGEPGFRIFLPAESKGAWISRLESEGVVAATEEEARTVRLEHGKPRYGDDIFPATLPQETLQMHGVHFAKGCYLGQEIVERIRSRGHVNRLLTKLEVEGTAPLARGTKVYMGEAEAGEITSSAFSPALGKVVALAYLRAQYAVTTTVLRAGDRLAAATS